MTDPIILHLPESMVELIHRAADESNRSVEEMLLSRIRVMYEEPEILLDGDNLDTFSDEDLWTVVYQRAAWKQQARARSLIAQGKESQLSEAKHEELEELLQILDKYVLLRSKALALLNHRGYDTASLF